MLCSFCTSGWLQYNGGHSQLLLESCDTTISVRSLYSHASYVHKDTERCASPDKMYTPARRAGKKYIN